MGHCIGTGRFQEDGAQRGVEIRNAVPSGETFFFSVKRCPNIDRDIPTAWFL